MYETHHRVLELQVLLLPGRRRLVLLRLLRAPDSISLLLQFLLQLLLYHLTLLRLGKEEHVSNLMESLQGTHGG